MNVRPKIPDFFILARRVNTIREQHNVATFVEIPPDRGAGEAEVAYGSSGKMTPADGLAGRRCIPAERKIGITYRLIFAQKLVDQTLWQERIPSLQEIGRAHV